MRLGDLSKFGVPQKLIEFWRERQGEGLLPVQRRALQKGLLGHAGDTVGRSLIICAPTSSGKSFCAELAAAGALTRRKKVLLLFPLKSLAEEKYRLIRESYTDLGIRTIISTGDHPENDQLLIEGRFDIAIAIYEKLDLLLSARLDLLGNIGLLVIDELQMIAEPGRGAILERLLTKLRASCYRPQLLGFSAVIGDESGQALAKWLNADLVEESTRPVELIRGVAADGSYRYRKYNSGEDGSEPFKRFDTSSDLVDGLIASLKEKGQATLVFLKSRHDTVSLAMRLASAMTWPAAAGCLERLKEEESSYLVRTLQQVLGRGVAFHNADLSSGQRQIIENGFANKEIRTLISTTTLAMGVNLPAETVYLETVKYQAGIYGERPTLIPISRAEFDNMTGRAGRLGISDRQPGRAIILADSEFDRDILWENYIAPSNGQRVTSAFDSMPLSDWLLHLIVAGLVNGKSSAHEVLGHSFRASTEGIDDLSLKRSIEQLIENNLISVDHLSGELAATSSGRAVALSGLTVRAARYYLSELAISPPETPFGWIALALSGPNWSLPAGLLSRFEQRQNMAVKMLYQRFDYSVEEAACLLPGDHRRVPLQYRQAASLKAVLLLDDWRRLTSVQRLEEQYQLHLGQIAALGETAAHLISALAALLEATDRESPLIASLRDQAFSLRHGLPEEYRQIYEHLGALLNRSDLLRLKEHGVECLGDLFEATQENLKRMFISDEKHSAIQKKLETLKEEVDMNATLNRMPMAVSEPELIEIDGSPCGERFMVRINGFAVPLTGKSFKYFAKLAWSRLSREGGWIYKEDIEIGFNQARYLYRMKNEISAGFRSEWPLLENNRLGYYRLNIPAERIRVNLDVLKSHPDHDIRSLVLGGDGQKSVN